MTGNINWEQVVSAEAKAATHVATAVNLVRAEAQRRIVALTGAADLQSSVAKQLNALMRAMELTNKRTLGVTLTAEEEAEAAALQGLADSIKAIRAASNILGASMPEDVAADHHWP